jgi:vacuolar-type H+-ATPase subunit E/Vma4
MKDDEIDQKISMIHSKRIVLANRQEALMQLFEQVADEVKTIRQLQKTIEQLQKTIAQLRQEQEHD